jgi:hypothetical protein
MNAGKSASTPAGGECGWLCRTADRLGIRAERAEIKAPVGDSRPRVKGSIERCAMQVNGDEQSNIYVRIGVAVPFVLSIRKRE